jgi:hypothetical protein
MVFRAIPTKFIRYANRFYYAADNVTVYIIALFQRFFGYPNKYYSLLYYNKYKKPI